MKTSPRPILITFTALVLACGVCTDLFAQGTAFTYQGRLNGSGGPATGVYNMNFSLYNVASGGSAVSGPLPVTGIPVSIQSVSAGGGAVSFLWDAVPGPNYQLQYLTNLVNGVWQNLGLPTGATNGFLGGSDSIGPDRQRFYRLVPAQ
jgi:hypothetical protein